MRAQAHCAVWLLLLPYLFPGVRAAEETAATAAPAPVALEVFKAPKMLKLRPPNYPESERRRGNEGWVQLNFMVDPQGKPYEIGVLQSTGGETFERAAVRAAQSWLFEPARLGDTPVSAGYHFKVLFFFKERAQAANPSFVRAYEKLLQAINAGDKSAAGAQLDRLYMSNLYEAAYTNLGRFYYARKWGTEGEQIEALRGAVAHEELPTYLPKDVFIPVLDSLLVLEVKNQDYGSALDTWKKLQQLAPPASLEKRQQLMARVAARRAADGAYQVPGRIADDRTSWFYRLFRLRFQFAVASGHLSEIKLRCEKHYVFFEFQPDVQYKVPEQYGDCTLEAVGDPGTKFDLIQS